VPSLIEKGHTPESIRFALFSSHYRSKLTFSELKLIESKKAIHRINDVYDRLKNVQNIKPILPTAYSDFLAALSDDLNTPKALGILFSFIKDINQKLDEGLLSNENIAKSIYFIESADKIFSFLTTKDKIPEDLSKLMIRREKARKNRDYKLSDQLRDEILKKGWIIEDTTDGTKCYKA